MSGAYESLRADIENIPVIDCHEHTAGPEFYHEHEDKTLSPYNDPLAALVQGYVCSDVESAACGDLKGVNYADSAVSLDERWKAFEPIWKRTEHTGYARVTKWVLKEIYGEDELTRDTLDRVATKLLATRDPEVYWGVVDKAGIKCRLVNIWVDMKDYLDGKHTLPERDRYLIPLPSFHSIKSYSDVMEHANKLAGVMPVTLDEYIDACRTIFTKMQQRGAIGMKDQSAYERTLKYDNATRADAERLFNSIMEDPRRSLGRPESKPMEDYLFHQFMIIARDLDMPVQIHTGHMAGIYNDIEKTNAIHFTSVLELHKEVRFDLFHGNWPYSGEWLYLAKNYPNVALDCCWLHIIDPAYSRDVLYQAVTAVPHGKIHGFGGDYGDSPEFAAGHMAIARDNIAAALGRHVDEGWLDEAEALSIAADWLFNNPNRFFKLGFDEVSV